jgi:hypothetical protein
LTQAWFDRAYPDRPAYRLYALSNAGSLIALVSYPFLFEPNLSLRAHAYIWTGAYAIFVIGSGYLVLGAHRRARANDPPAKAVRKPGTAARPSVATYGLWIALAAGASGLLIAVTNQITQEVAVVPFLWVLPLTAYLLTFILAFSGGWLYSRRLYLVAFFGLSFVTVRLLVGSTSLGIGAQISLHALLLFVCCMICHNELYKLRPDTRYLPSFYVMVAAGGAVGGIFATLLAPYLFTTGFWELHWVLIACGILFTLVLQRERRPAQRRQQRRARRRSRDKRASRQDGVFRRWNLTPALIASSIAVLLLGAYTVVLMRAFTTGTLWTARNFYGVLRVWEINTSLPGLSGYQLTHGKTVHGSQFKADDLRREPTTFYSRSSGLGLAIANHPSGPGSLRVGGLGMGIGVIASYGTVGDQFRFYELNPDVIRIARGEEGFFSFLADSEAEVEVIPGDARVSLARELIDGRTQSFDLLVLDAFSGDAVPLHLLTVEAFEVYLEHLRQDGVIAINVSNRYFHLDLEVFRLADELDLNVAKIEDRGDGVRGYDSVWMLLTRDPDFLEQPAITSRIVERPAIPENLIAWTDDFSNLLRVVK